MTETTFDIASLPSLLDTIKQLPPDTELILTNGSTPVAKLQPIKASSAVPRRPDLHPGVWLSDDFNDLLPDHYWSTRST
ncbi:MAG: hypothetical protein LCI00_11360 [Chloroflexi bacterium]|nr:hypothetical protein [Chloroflexota bacterium]MCC6896178.1 hypothetical protein [Anaerolineae bacterium]